MFSVLWRAAGAARVGSVRGPLRSLACTSIAPPILAQQASSISWRFFYCTLLGLFTFLQLSLQNACATQLAKLIPDDASTYGWFGNSVALDGGTALVGANPLSNPAGVFAAGSAYVFEQDVTGQWNQLAELIPNDSSPGDRFGDSVALSGGYAVIGATTGNGSANRTGQAYVFEKADSGSWNEVAKLTSPTPFNFNAFGKSVAIDGDTLVVGSGGDTGPIGEIGGRAYVFKRDEFGGWNQTATLSASDAESSDGFGYPSVSISGNRIIVGAYLDDNVASEAGSAYIFEEDTSGQWNEVAKLVASDAGQRHWFGWSVDILEDTAVVASPNSRTQASSAVHVFREDASGAWVEQARLVPDDALSSVIRGDEVAISEDLILFGTSTNDFGQFTGSAFAFRIGPDCKWHQVAKLLADDAAGGDHFGNSISLDGDNALIGAWIDDYSGYTDSGSVYLFRVPIPEPPARVLAFCGLLFVGCHRCRSHKRGTWQLRPPPVAPRPR